MKTPVRVAIVEDDGAVRDTLTRLIGDSGDLAPVGAFASAEAAIAGLDATRPDVVLMDINLTGHSGIECVAQLRQRGFSALILMLTTFDDAGSVFESLKAGANGYVLKRSAGTDLLDAIRDVIQGGAPMTSSIARQVVGYFRKRGPAPEVESLTDREREVLNGLSEGRQYKEIGGLLGISLNTVRKHIRAIYDKLHVGNRMEAVKKLG
jgi:DNA-binding NarL/FixJ family response regulator